MAKSHSLTLVREALDQAIAQVAEAEYGRLSEGMSLGDQAKSVDHALKSLTRLQQGIPPDYRSEWIALFYLTWYQPRQIHLASAALRQLLVQTPPPRHIIDYGCGALAFQLALAVVLAEQPDGRYSGIAVHGIDSSKPMMDIGKELWDRFREITGSRSHDDPLFEALHVALDAMGDVCSFHTSLSEALTHLQTAPRAPESDDCWLTAIHAIYQSNLEQLKDVLDADKCQRHGISLTSVTFYQSGIHRSFFEALGTLP